ncbi:Protein kinase domain [Pelomyxa schiedti]|nr:Protein kinase domain [Pelomyxa schiedti]
MIMRIRPVWLSVVFGVLAIGSSSVTGGGSDVLSSQSSPIESEGIVGSSPSPSSTSTSPTSSSSGVSEAERELLRAEAQAVCDLYNELKPVNWKDPCEEYTEEPPCNETAFFGLSCFDGHICSISLGSRTTKQGTIPQTIGNFSQLRNLDLSHDDINGVIPDTLSRLQLLAKLSFWRNNLTGEILCLQNLTSLMSIDLGSNLLTGTLPLWFSEFHFLLQLTLNANHFSGTVPPLPQSLQVLNLADNSFTSGTLDISSNLTCLLHLDLTGNQFSGSIPSSIFSMSSLNYLFLSRNQFTGSIPPELLCSLNKLSWIRLDENFLSGTLPTCSLSTSLGSIQLSSNQLSGDLPATLFVTTVKKLLLQNNLFSGTLPISPKALSKLLTLDLSSNMISGTIPQAFWVSLPRLNSINMSHNLLGGSIENYNSTTVIFDLSYNFLNGTLPLVLSEGKFVHCQLEQNCFTCNGCVMCQCNNTRGPSECFTQIAPSSSSSSSSTPQSLPPSSSQATSFPLSMPVSVSLPPGSMSASPPPAPSSSQSQSQPPSQSHSIPDDSSFITSTHSSSNYVESLSSSQSMRSHFSVAILLLASSFFLYFVM